MNMAKRALVTGLMAAALLASSFGFTPPSAHAEVPETLPTPLATTCLDISHLTALVASEYNSPATSSTRKAELVDLYGQILQLWIAKGCDDFFGSLPLLKTPTATGTANQVEAPPASQPTSPTTTNAPRPAGPSAAKK